MIEEKRELKLPEGGSIDIRTLVSKPAIEVEIGSGRGTFLLGRAVAMPEVSLIGLEIKKSLAAVTETRLLKHGYRERVRVFAEDVKIALSRLIPDQIVRCVYVHFPDPWWKRRHQRRLVIQEEVLKEVVRLLEVGGELFIQTDVANRADEYEQVVAQWSCLEPAGDTDGSCRLSENPYQARSWREQCAIRDGLPIFRLRFRKNPSK